MPGDDSLKAEIETDWDFNPNVVPTFISAFRDTLTFAGLIEGNRLLLEGVNVSPADDDAEQEDEMKQQTESPPITNAPIAKVGVGGVGRHVAAEVQSHFAGPSVRFGLPRNNYIEIRMGERVSAEEFAKVKKIFDLSEMTFVQEQEPARLPTILAKGLNIAESDRLDDINGTLASTFDTYDLSVRFCQADGVGNDRRLKFLSGLNGPPIMTRDCPTGRGTCSPCPIKRREASRSV